MEKVLNAVNKTKAIIVDGDNTLWKGRVAEHIGKEYLIGQVLRRNFGNVFKGTKEAMKIKFLLRKNKDNEKPETEGIKLFYNLLIDWNLGEKQTFERIAKYHFERNSIKPVQQIVVFSTVKKLLATLGGSTAAEVAKNYYCLDDFVSNIDIFRKIGYIQKLDGIDIVMSNGAEKLEMVEKWLRKYKIKIKDCAVIGDSLSDLPLLEKAGISISSPGSVNRVKDIADFQM